jgi:dTDP-4-dehydrorhamnose 3,5-epimerase
MEFRKTRIEGLIEVFPQILEDDRGIFFESYSERKFVEAGLDLKFVQDNQSFSTKGVLRGLHYQRDPFAQGKLVKVSLGKALDIAVDLRKDSSTFGQYETFILDPIKHNMVYIPEGFAHGFVALEDTILSYKCTNFYNKPSECGIIWNDPTLNIDWTVDNPKISVKDAELFTLQELIDKGLTF